MVKNSAAFDRDGRSGREEFRHPPPHGPETWPNLTHELLQEHGCVMPAESEGVIENAVDLHFAGLVRGEIEVAFRIWIIQVDRRGNDLFLNGFDADNRLDSSGRAEHMP